LEACISSSTARRRGGSVDPVSLLGGLTDRDLYLLDVLDVHRVLTALQVAALLFPSLDRAQRRLMALTERGVLARFRGYVRPGSQAWRYTLGYAGAALVAASRGRDGPPPRSRHDRALATLARSSQLDHRLGVNGVFTALAGHAATAPGARLWSWYCEATTVDLLTTPSGNRTVWPDGYGRWSDPAGDLGFLLEYDTGSEPLRRLVDKLTAYQANAHHRLAVLLHLPSTARESNLHRLARGGYGYPVATTAADRIATAGHSLAGPVWLRLGAPTRRLRLAELAQPDGRTLWADWRHRATPPPAVHLPLVA
jgi:hypothetical protein